MYPDCCFIVGDAEVHVTNAYADSKLGQEDTSGAKQKLSPAQWAQLIAAIAAAIAQILSEMGSAAPTLNKTGGATK